MGVTQTLLYMTCVCLARDLVSCDNFEETGKDITLTPSIRGHPTDILWKHNGNKVLEYDGSEVLKYGSFTGRVEVDFETGELTIRKLKSQDSGQYQSDIVINEKVQTSTHTVTVLDALLDPQVTCELSESSNASKKLLCSVESQTQPSYEWSGPNINVRSGPELLVDEQEENRDSVYTCTVKNQVNSKSAAFNLKDCPIGRAGSTVPVPVLTVTILLVIFLLLLAILIFIYIRKKKRMRKCHEKNIQQFTFKYTCN
ncbi:lymphocyte function-associated antigen 3 [Pseudorasbora parva]|uniref:lymphocyte function-associated antigen 3 n=1 Tax=Pseudorasbora parva TaxID=51549 RepID=UPI00351DB215